MIFPVLMDVVTAKAKYPAAWCSIEAGMEEVRSCSNCLLKPYAAQVIVVRGIETLEVIASTDLFLDGASESDESMNLRFHASIVPLRATLKLVT